MSALVLTIPNQLLLVVMILNSIGLMAWSVVAWKRLYVTQNVTEQPTSTAVTAEGLRPGDILTYPTNASPMVIQCRSVTDDGWVIEGHGKYWDYAINAHLVDGTIKVTRP